MGGDLEEDNNVSEINVSVSVSAADRPFRSTAQALGHKLGSYQASDSYKFIYNADLIMFRCIYLFIIILS